jgi:UPF0271 protein
MPAAIDLNCDMGESFGAWSMGADAAVMPLISSASIACGFHAGDPAVMQSSVRLALDHAVAIGAHVSLPDLQGFGRREMALSAQEAYQLTLYQLGALDAFVRTQSARMAHCKPHGALYNMAARDRALADAIAQAVRDFDPGLVLFGLSGSALPAAGEALGLAVAHEVFADRSYESDGSLTARRIPGAVLAQQTAVATQATQLALHGTLSARDGVRLQLRADSICVHGDRDAAAEFAHAIRAALDGAGMTVRAPSGAGR